MPASGNIVSTVGTLHWELSQRLEGITPGHDLCTLILGEALPQLRTWQQQESPSAVPRALEAMPATRA